VLAIRAKDYPLEKPKERQKLEKLLVTENMYCGISAMFGNFMDLRCYYVQSRFTADYCRSQPNMALCCYDECYEEHIMQSLANMVDLKCFCHPKILALWDSNDENQRLLIRCLHQFLLNGKNISLTAKSLYVHRNTLIYRLGKLSELLGEDIMKLTQGRTFRYLFSCMLTTYFENHPEKFSPQRK
jgi:sugar diacid utilization regulator